MSRLAEIPSTNEQRCQDWLRKYSTVVTQPCYLQVGASDGISGDPFGRLFLNELTSWKGVLFEPNPLAYELLSEKYSDKNRFSLHMMALGKETGERIFYYFDEKTCQDSNRPFWLKQLGSFDEHHLLRLYNSKEGIVSYPAKTITLHEVMANSHVEVFDLVVIDVEGFEFEVLSTLDLTLCKPKSIFLEHRHVSDENLVSILEKLIAANYIVYDCGFDLMAVSDELHEEIPFNW